MAVETTNERYKVIESYYQDVVRYLSKFGLNKDDLSDAIQDTFVEAIANAASLRDESKAKNWLIKIARTTGLKYKRKSKYKSTSECSFEQDMVQLESINAYEKDILEELILKAEAKLLRDSLLKLKKKERQTILYQYIYDHSLNEIARIINESLTNTKTISRRARLKLQKLLIDGGCRYGK